MTSAPYTEDTLVQQTTVDYLEQPLGWESIYAHNAEDFGPNSLLGHVYPTVPSPYYGSAA